MPKITLYSMFDDPKVIEKNIYSNSSTTLDGKFRSPVDVCNPVMTIESGNLTLQQGQYNYCYIDSLQRYYFITDVIPTTSRIKEIHMHIDVLFTYQNLIKGSSGTVTTSGATGIHSGIMPSARTVTEAHLLAPKTQESDSKNVITYTSGFDGSNPTYIILTSGS